LIALVLTTKNRETIQHIHAKHKRETEETALGNQTNYTLVCMPLTTSGQETQQALFLQQRSPHGAT